MVDYLSIVMISFSIVIVFGLPIGLGVYLYLKKRISILAVLVGVFGFLVPQVMIRIPLLGMLSTTEFYQALTVRPLLLGLFLGLTAGLFEETGRWIGFRYLLKNRLERKNALAYGVGHGGFEAIYLVGLGYISNLVISLMINNGAFESLIAPQLGANADTVRITLISTPAYMFLVGGIERVFAIAIQLGLSVMVYLAVKRRQARYYWVAVLMHTLVNFPVVLFASRGVSLLWIEGWVALCAAAAVWYIFYSRKLEPAMEIVPPEPIESNR